jgi:pantoate--beta-alanine ligase
MLIFHSIEECISWRINQKTTVGFVPTMGALHDGHLSLVDLSQNKCNKTIVSIFINPTQFAANEDLDSYPKTIDKDLRLLKEKNVDAVFMPTAEQMYNQKSDDYFFESELSYKLEGKSRPHFFKGVTTIVHKLFNIVNPTHTVFGQKDAQQLLIVEQMIEKKHSSIYLIKGPIVRNNKGLALSSRNNYLSKKDRLTASNIYKSLMNIKNALSNGNKKTASLKKIFSDYINDFSGFSIDYISIADTQTLEEIPMVDRRVLISTAVVLDKVRLIDNFIYSPST